MERRMEYQRTLEAFKKGVKIARREVLDEDLYRKLSDHFVEIEKLLSDGKRTKK